MADKMDWAAAMSSEVFRNYAQNELLKEAQEEAQAAAKIISKDSALDNFEGLQRRVNASPKLRGVFKKLQQAFTSNPEYTAKVDPNFVEGVLLLNVEDE